jgi:dsRNA-specific ribonuclease
MKNTTRKTLLITAATAALIGGAGLASAQGTNENREAPGAAAHNQKAPEGKTDQHPGSLPRKSPAPTAQAPTKEKPASTAQAPAVSKPETTGQEGFGVAEPSHGSDRSKRRAEVRCAGRAVRRTACESLEHAARCKGRPPDQRAFLNLGR